MKFYRIRGDKNPAAHQHAGDSLVNQRLFIAFPVVAVVMAGLFFIWDKFHQKRDENADDANSAQVLLDEQKDLNAGITQSPDSAAGPEKRDESGSAQNFSDEHKDPVAGTARHVKGSQIRITQSPDKSLLMKKKYGPDGNLELVTAYHMDDTGKLLGGKIYDGTKTQLYKVAYGYRKSDGQLVEERMFDSRNPKIDPETGNEMPVMRISHTINAEGERSAPIVLDVSRDNKQLEDFQRQNGISTLSDINLSALGD